MSDQVLTAAQEKQLVALFRANARSAESGASIYFLAEHGQASPLVLGALRDRGLSESRTVRSKGGSQFTAYWLTAGGVERARQLQRAPNG